MKRRNLAAVALAALTGLCAPALHAQTKWDLAAAYPATNFHTENLAQFISDVDKGSGGKLKITLHANAALFKAPEIKRAVQGAQAQLGEILLANFQNEWQIFGVDGLPFLADSYDASMKLYKAQKPFLEKKLAEQGMVLLYAVAWPPQGIYTKKPVNNAADLKGIKWRAYSPATARIAELVGAQPVTVQAAEFSQALATGVVESTMTSGATGVDSKLYEHLKYYYDTQAWLPKNALIMNKKAFDALDKPVQEAVLKAAADAETRGWAASRRVNEDTLAKLKAEGMQVVPPSSQLKADMAKVGDTMLKEWLDKAGPDGKALIDAYRK
ncbi:MAG: TRAP transporter substrate-binding protein [Diaphorobacter nitroreducens]|jgi:TRAP-type C4-dicarboxylate transport system substrate-binding protein|uniref:TRAP-type C4-dicarboxylate transport system substrate-binding protein n=3 Tax=Diaphorobacter TaxID=238749 RepID=A0AAX1WRS2_9BURK|nr:MULTISPECIES: TRAP transporter substrate-binding protein [Diaphorobacter]ACM32841.1 TRAP dicarboxylate transporter- DctP subunit [[Acidovorax] ebreus TPSY]ASI68353.1 C4-dicarboxylate ABC transporter substrate-binding protein [Diaphorobacter nitroreducens]QYY27019.1 TRAP transporter substrate-binding protein [Diaphorobacter sp. MNS-0]ROR40320.1 TRAP-type C4-dicarboxylate transport system substrate-binding protein [Diaphorobacter nitroreducens]WKK90175.1 TRAP transporter substrate-binding pro